MRGYMWSACGCRHLGKRDATLTAHGGLTHLLKDSGQMSPSSVKLDELTNRKLHPWSARGVLAYLYHAQCTDP